LETVPTVWGKGSEIISSGRKPMDSEVEPNNGGGMPEKRLMYESSVVGIETDREGEPIKATLVELWGKSRNRRARERTLPRERRNYVSGGGYSYMNHGAVVSDGTVYEVCEVVGERWWVRPVEWGETP